MSPLSIVLLVGAGYGVRIIFGLLRSTKTIVANRYLAALVFLVTLKLVPYILGFSGVYQRAPWLSYAPFELESGFGPLIFLYVLARTDAMLPKSWKLHLIPLAIEFFYYLVMFVQPLPFKDDWHDRVQVHIDKIDTVFGLASLGVYLTLSLVQIGKYQRFTENHLTQGTPPTIRFLRSVCWTFSVLLVLRTLFGVLSMINQKLTYDQSFLGYFWIVVVIFVVGTEAIVITDPLVPIEVTESLPLPEPIPKDWEKVASQMQERCRETKIWRDPLLSLQNFADLVGFSPSYVSKALNNGLDESFNTFINRHRVEEVTELIKHPGENRDVIEVAYLCGFNSKASFNRVFKQITGQTPTQYRASCQLDSEPNS